MLVHGIQTAPLAHLSARFQLEHEGNSQSCCATLSGEAWVTHSPGQQPSCEQAFDGRWSLWTALGLSPTLLCPATQSGTADCWWRSAGDESKVLNFILKSMSRGHGKEGGLEFKSRRESFPHSGSSWATALDLDPHPHGTRPERS